MARPFSWSFSKLKNFEVCPFKYLKVDVQKQFKEDTANLDWGNKVHDAMRLSLTTGAPLPPEMDIWQHWADGIRALPGELLVEQKFAITREFVPCEYFAPKVWFRSIVDALKIRAPFAGAFDWKTGKINHDSVQLVLSTACIFAFHPEIEKVRTSFIWLQDNEVTTDDYTREDIKGAWPAILERVHELEASHEKMLFPPKPGGLCKNYCPVQTCEFWRKGNRP